MNSLDDKGGGEKNYDRRSAVFSSYCQFREALYSALGGGGAGAYPRNAEKEG